MYGARRPTDFTHLTSSSTILLDKLSSLTALLTALDDLDKLFESIEEAYAASLHDDEYEVFEEKS